MCCRSSPQSEWQTRCDGNLEFYWGS
jgi:hypothetical protein